MLEQKENTDGSLTIVLTENGKRKALTYQIDEMKIKKTQKWDKKWRVVLFDICKNEIEYIIEFYNIRKYVRFIMADSLDNELHLINHFKLN